jgi:hypothetical protein
LERKQGKIRGVFMGWAEYKEYAEGGIGAIVGSLMTIIGFKSRLDKAEVKQDEIEKDCAELKAETLAMFREIRKNINDLITKTTNRRADDQ